MDQALGQPCGHKASAEIWPNDRQSGRNSKMRFCPDRRQYSQKANCDQQYASMSDLACDRQLRTVHLETVASLMKAIFSEQFRRGTRSVFLPRFSSVPPSMIISRTTEVVTPRLSFTWNGQT